MVKMAVDARHATEATGGVPTGTLRRVRKHNAAAIGIFAIAVDLL